MATEDLGKMLGEGAKDKENMKSELTQPGSRITRFLFGKYELQLLNTELLIEEQTIGTAFILGHSTNGVLGTSALGSGTMSSYSTLENNIAPQSLTILGRNEVTRWLNSESSDEPSHIGFGTDSTPFTVDDVSLGSEVGTRLVVTADTSSSKEVSYQAEIYSTSDIIGSSITETGLFNASTSGDIFSRYTYSTIATVNTKNYRFTIKISLIDNSLGRGILTNAGMNHIRDWMGLGTGTAPGYMAWGGGTTAVDPTDTTLLDEKKRNAFISNTRVDNVDRFLGLLATGEATTALITRSGLFNHATTGILFAEQQFTGIQKTSNIQIQEEDKFTVI